MRAIYSDRASSDLLVAVDWISDTSIPLARRLIDAIESTCLVLGDFPYIGGQREWLTDKTLRVLDIRGWLIIYRPDSAPPVILRIVYGKSDLTAVET